MVSIKLELQPQTEERLRKILAQYQDQETFAQNIIAFQMTELKRAILNLRLDLQQFEEKYQLGTDQFYERFQKGLVDDSDEFQLWAGVYEMYRENRRKLEELQ
jgi:hypothetical protein